MRLGDGHFVKVDGAIVARPRPWRACGPKQRRASCRRDRACATGFRRLGSERPWRGLARFAMAGDRFGELRPTGGFFRGEAAHWFISRAALLSGMQHARRAPRQHAAGDALGLVARAPEGIDAVGALDRAAGVLRDPQAVGFAAIESIQNGAPSGTNAGSAATLTPPTTG